MGFHSYPTTFIEQVHLRVKDLQRSVTFYLEVIGFRILSQTDTKAILTADGKTGILTLEVPKNVESKKQRTTGLYHFALLLPERSDLANILKHFVQIQYPLQGASDHLVSEAIYLADPDGNGIEIYTDRNESTWKWEDGDVIMDTAAIDSQSLLAESKDSSWTGLPADTVMGHIHLHVSELDRTREFYVKGLGFEVVNKLYGSQALFISSGNYHHHIGLNTWNGVGIPAPSDQTVGLKFFTIVLPSEEVRRNIINELHLIGAPVIEEEGELFTKDPSGNKMQLAVYN